MASSILSSADNLIATDFQCVKGRLEEPKVGMRIQVDDTGVDYKIYSFDFNLDKKNYPKGLYPFFNKIAEAHAVCDYTLFVTQGGKVFVLLVELKLGNAATANQLRAGECMAKFVVDTINRINNTNYSPEYRKITVSGTKLVHKGSTKMHAVNYTNRCADFKGRIFCIQQFLK